MTTKKLTYSILIFISMISCVEHSQPDEKVISEIFPDLVDSLVINKSNLIPPPPPLSGIYDNDSNFIGIDTIAEKLIIDQHVERIRIIESMDSRTLIGLIDSSITIDWVNIEQRSYLDIPETQKIISDNNQTNEPPRKWKLDLLQPPSDIQLSYQSDLEEKYVEIWRINERKFGGLIAISRIYYSNDKRIGLLQFESYPFIHEGTSYFLVIEQINGNWKIKRILMNWVS